MQDLIGNLVFGFSVAFTFNNILLCFVGCMIGTLIGVLPGLGPIATISILLPFTFGISPVGAMIMLAGVYYGAAYGGSTTAILIRMPGEASSIVTTIDGYAMAQQGRAGAALAVAAFGSFFAGCAATLMIGLFAVPLSKVALVFGAQEYFALLLLGLVFAIVLAGGSILRAVISVLIGVILSTIGWDVETGVQRLTFGVSSLFEGLDLAIVAMGIYGVGEILRNLGRTEPAPKVQSHIGRLLPTRDDVRRSIGPVLRGTALGSILGVLPGSGATLAPFASYVVEKKISKTPERFGKGAVEGLAGPESANNAASQTCFIPLLSLGLPPNATMALMLGALLIQGVVPGPQVLTKQPELFWGMVASMWLGNLMLLVINLPLIGMWVSLLKVPQRLLFPAILLICCIGLFSVNRIPVDIYFMAAFGVLGLGMTKLGFEPAPVLLGLVLGGPLEANFRRALIISGGDWTTFFNSWISITFLILAALMLVLVLLPAVRHTRETALQDDTG